MFTTGLLTNLIIVPYRFAITLTFLVVYLQGAEIFPTQLRSTGSGFASTVGAACGIMCPIMVALVFETWTYLIKYLFNFGTFNNLGEL
jgi:hypothetical protein